MALVCGMSQYMGLTRGGDDIIYTDCVRMCMCGIIGSRWIPENPGDPVGEYDAEIATQIINGVHS